MNGEFCYRNNPQSLFRKYAKLVTWFANTGIGRDYLGVPRSKISLMLPNGYEEWGGGRDFRSTFYTRSIFSPKLYSVLAKIDLVHDWLKDFDEAQRLLAWELGLTRRMPAIAEAVMFVTTTFNPNANPETTSVDGDARRSGVDQTWANIRAGAGIGAIDDGAQRVDWIAIASTTSSQYSQMNRSIRLFDTSSLGTDTVDSATLSTFSTGGHPKDLGSLLSTLVSSNPASNTAVASGDFAQAVYGTTRFATDITDANTDGGENQFTLNASGLTNIVNGISKFGIISANDFDNSAPTWSSGANSTCGAYNAEQTGATIPKLVVVHTAAGGVAGTAAFKSLLGVGL